MSLNKNPVMLVLGSLALANSIAVKCSNDARDAKYARLGLNRPQVVEVKPEDLGSLKPSSEHLQLYVTSLNNNPFFYFLGRESLIPADITDESVQDFQVAAYVTGIDAWLRKYNPDLLEQIAALQDIRSYSLELTPDLNSTISNFNWSRGSYSAAIREDKSYYLYNSPGVSCPRKPLTATVFPQTSTLLEFNEKAFSLYVRTGDARLGEVDKILTFTPFVTGGQALDVSGRWEFQMRAEPNQPLVAGCAGTYTLTPNTPAP